jgi:hypothetical protein
MVVTGLPRILGDCDGGSIGGAAVVDGFEVVGVSAVVCMNVWTSGAAGHQMRIVSDKRPTHRSNWEVVRHAGVQSPTLSDTSNCMLASNLKHL